MSMIPRSKLLGLIASFSILGSISCGGTVSNNDQGTSFLATGFFQDDGETGETGVVTPLATDAAASGNDGLTTLTFIGLQNRLSTQFIRVTRVDCSYNIAGASPTFVIPDDSFNFSTVLGPTAADGSDSSTGAVKNPQYSQFEIVSPDIYSYINVNRNQLPELPFRMTVTCHAVGVTQAGDTIDTNDLNFFVQFVDAAECCTGASGETPGTSGGFQNGAGNGGGINFEDGSQAGSGSTTGTGGATSGTGDATSGTATDGTTSGTTSSSSSSSSSGSTGLN